jgi:4-amino-4-deoxychorismate lyase
MFLETIRIENGQVCNLQYHQYRMDKTMRECLGINNRLDLRSFITCADIEGRTKCRIVYGEKVEEVTYSPYKMRTVSSLRIVKSEDIKYEYKRLDRSGINNLFEQRGECDDILICKNGLITDTSIGNVAFYDGLSWHTPAKPLLCGTQRQYLLDNNMIMSNDISVDSIGEYKEVMIFNAMIPFGELRLKIGCLR